jgi:hypothetical protein
MEELPLLKGKEEEAMWTCGPTPLSCLLINGVRTSTDEVVPELAKRQLRK